MKIALVSCTKLKQDHACKAKELYSPSSLFTKAVSFIEKQGYDDWFILSAKYGLLSKDTIVEPYDITLNNMIAKERKAWAAPVFEDILKLNPTQIDFYASEKYRQYLIPSLIEQGISCSVPLKGLGIGEQLHFYKNQLNGVDS